MRAKSWLARIPLIFQHLETDGQAFYTRAEVERLFIIGKSQATDLMKVAGATVHHGAEATVSRENLRFYLERCPEATVYLAEEARKEKQAQALREAAIVMERSTRFGEMIAGRAQPRDKYTTFEELVDLTIEDGKLTIVFSDAKDLAYKLYKLACAEAHEPEEFWKMCDPEVSEHRAPSIPARLATPEELDWMFSAPAAPGTDARTES
jgi:hypothetical protein